MKILKESYIEELNDTFLEFFDINSKEVRYSFPADEKGNVIPVIIDGLKRIPCSESECSWWGNYIKVKEDDSYFSHLNKESWKVKHLPTILCDCGEEFELSNEFYGSCGCPSCDRWYTISGQSCCNPDEQRKLPDF